MATTLVKHSSLLGLTAAQVETYIDTLLTTYKHSSERRQIISFLQDLIESDRVTLKSQHNLLRVAEVKLRALLKKVNHTESFSSFFVQKFSPFAKFSIRSSNHCLYQIKTLFSFTK